MGLYCMYTRSTIYDVLALTDDRHTGKREAMHNSMETVKIENKTLANCS